MDCFSVVAVIVVVVATIAHLSSALIAFAGVRAVVDYAWWLWGFGRRLGGFGRWIGFFGRSGLARRRHVAGPVLVHGVRVEMVDAEGWKGRETQVVETLGEARVMEGLEEGLCCLDWTGNTVANVALAKRGA